MASAVVTWNPDQRWSKTVALTERFLYTHILFFTEIFGYQISDNFI
jgi:hypothetical protein